MDFCPVCGTRLISSSNVQHCLKCQFKTESPPERAENRRKPQKPEDTAVYVLDEAAMNLRTMPVVNVFCEACDRIREAETWMIAGESSGISSITFFRCVACRHTWRETDRG
ncbi:MAG: hypothetical protein JSV20_06985 [Candidatus Bathyarchaeota archaeon]|nr:MAG: hypothetical protein JSV20_06985 [Candidatus Bathyarchaeota archaeon]